jgi:hypothetical protein
MKIDITFKSDTTPNLRTLKRWQDLTGADAVRLNANGVDQFGYFPPYITDAADVWCGSWVVNDNYSILTHDDIMQVYAMQNSDEFLPAQKMAYLASWGDSWGSPWRVPNNYAWTDAPEIKQIGCYYAGQ